MFAIPATGAPELEAELNHFLRSHRVVSVKKSLEIWEENPRWCFCVEYMEGPAPTTAPSGRKPRIDYREVLSEEDFAVFARLRDLRRELTADGTGPQIQRKRAVDAINQLRGTGNGNLAAALLKERKANPPSPHGPERAIHTSPGPAPWEPGVLPSKP